MHGILRSEFEDSRGYQSFIYMYRVLSVFIINYKSIYLLYPNYKSKKYSDFPFFIHYQRMLTIFKPYF